MRNRKHFIQMLDSNPSATINIMLAADMVYSVDHQVVSAAADHRDEDWKKLARELKYIYGESMTVTQVKDKMAA